MVKQNTTHNNQHTTNQQKHKEFTKLPNLQIHSMRKFNPPSVKLTANGLQGDGLMYF
jgi:hypothetical protein